VFTIFVNANILFLSTPWGGNNISFGLDRQKCVCAPLAKTPRGSTVQDRS
jgi:hypothetical protein